MFEISSLSRLSASTMEETTKKWRGDPVCRQSPGEITAGTLHLTRTSASRRCCFAIVQHHRKDLSGSVPLITFTDPELCFSSELFVLQLLELSAWPWGREQQEMGMEHHGVLWKGDLFLLFPPLFTEGKLQNVPPKIFWCFSHKLQWLIDVTVFYCKSNSCTHYAAIRVLTNCWIFLSIQDCNDLQSWQYCKKEGKLKLEQI